VKYPRWSLARLASRFSKMKHSLKGSSGLTDKLFVRNGRRKRHSERNPGSYTFKERIVSFAINTNIASLQAQEYLRTNSDFQAKTINRVTSGLRIISSG